MRESSARTAEYSRTEKLSACHFWRESQFEAASPISYTTQPTLSIRDGFLNSLLDIQFAHTRKRASLSYIHRGAFETQRCE